MPAHKLMHYGNLLLYSTSNDQMVNLK